MEVREEMGRGDGRGKKEGKEGREGRGRDGKER